MTMKPQSTVRWSAIGIWVFFYIIPVGLFICLYPGQMARASCDFLSVEGPCKFTFPADHGPHPGYRTEWWYYTGNLENDARNHFGFQLTFFRVQTSPNCQSDDGPDQASAWRTKHIYFAHVALTDVADKGHYQAQAAARNALGMAGVSQDQGQTTIFLSNWQAIIESKEHRLSAQTRDFGFDLKLTPLKPPVSHGQDGYSQKGTSPQRASCYYSFTRLATKGNIRINEKTSHVDGLSWMDHEYSTAPLEPGIVGWDWFSLQLSDQTELMMFLLRNEDGTHHPASSGTMVNARGDVQHLGYGQFSIQVRQYWLSPATQARYPSRWHIRIPAIKLNLDVQPSVANQEMQTQATTGVTYWEGSIDALGTRQDRSIRAKGYVEMTGYDKEFDAPM